MKAKITSKRQTAIPARAPDAMGPAGAGNGFELRESLSGFPPRPMPVDSARLAPLRGKIRRDRGPFDLRAFRRQRHEPALRD